VDKALSIQKSLPNIKKIIYWESSGLAGYPKDVLISFSGVIELGRQHETKYERLFEEELGKGRGDDIAVIMYTSGTSGKHPKGVVHTHKHLIKSAMRWLKNDPWAETDDYVSYISAAWGEQTGALSTGLVAGVRVNFPEKPETVKEDIIEISPHILWYSAGLWQDLASYLKAKIIDSGKFRRIAYAASMRIGYKVARAQFEKKKIGLLTSAVYQLFDWIMFKPLRSRIGARRTRVAYTVGGTISEELIVFFWAIGIRIKSLYASTEALIQTLHKCDDVYPESVGAPADGVQLRISAGGEIVVKSDSVFLGYHRDPEKTLLSLRDGWFYTGDAGYIDSRGHLIYLDRLSDLVELSSGERFSPQYVESKLMFCPYVQRAVAIGDRHKPFVAVLINIDSENVGKWLEHRNISYSTYAEMSQRDEVAELIRKEIGEVNQKLLAGSKVVKFVNLPKILDADEGDLTRSRKLRRADIHGRYKEFIDGIYAGLDQIVVSIPVKYRDGREATVDSTVRIRCL
jgi:long-chain acyl-CoA synthetase